VTFQFQISSFPFENKIYILKMIAFKLLFNAIETRYIIVLVVESVGVAAVAAVELQWQS
jgi:hypothetical protein